MQESLRFLIGVDLGKATISFAVGELSEDGVLKNIRTSCERHYGKPIELFSKKYIEFDNRSIAGIAATGIYSNRFAAPVIAGVPEEIAQEWAVSKLISKNGPINIIRLGASGYSVLTRSESGRFHYEKNDKCSAGTGETIEKICGRLGASLDEAIKSAAACRKSVPITARCSVFAKTEMTHYANQGEPHERLFRGYFESVAKNIFSLYEKNKVSGPGILIGNGARINPIRIGLGNLIAEPMKVSDNADVFEAVGALYYVLEHHYNDIFEWPTDPESLVKDKKRRIFSINPESVALGSVVRLEDNPVSAASSLTAAYLGLDLGSTGSKAALIDAKSKAVIADVYRRTEGNPVEAAKALVAEIIEISGVPVTAIGLTGSGRDAAKTVFRAAYPELDSKIYVQNEIVAHSVAAIRYDPDKGQSLSIVEIGGQDAKFINIQDGRIIDSDMNRACSAGTGSFLEEQAIFYGVNDISRFGELAAAAKNTPDLGQMCTVFIADLAAEALNEGYTLEDIFSGFQYSVILNYKNRVMGNRRFMDRIFFQGKPATNPSLAKTLAAVTGRQVYVPPNPGAMGAIGIAMLAGESVEGMEDDRPFDLRNILGATIVDRRTFQCNDRKCRNMCRIEAATVEVEGVQSKITSGGSCPKYEDVSAGSRKLPRNAPNAYRERRDLMDGMLAKVPPGSGPTVGIPYGHFLIDYLPFFYTFFSKIGARVEVARSGLETFPLGNRRCSANNTCTPVKIMHGLARADVDYMFLPKIVDIPRLVKESGTITCPMTQAAPELIEKALEAEGAEVRILRPIFRLGGGGFQSPGFVFELRKVWKELAKHPGIGRSNHLDFARAYYEALLQQRSFEKELLVIGQRSLDFARKEDFPVVLILGSSHVIHEPIMNAGIHDLVTRNGAVAIPLDCFSIPDSVPPLKRVYWGVSNRIMRASLAAANDGNIFPLMLISYGCGPSSFVEHAFNDFLEHYPHTVLESDGHGGQAGYITRVQAFLHSALSYRKSEKPAVPPAEIERYEKFPDYSHEEIKKSRLVVMGISSGGGNYSSEIYKARGYDADFMGEFDSRAFGKGREACSGKECLPYQLIWSSFRKYLVDNPPEDHRKTMLLNATGEGPCRNCMFLLANEIAAKKMGLGDKVGVVSFGSLKPDILATSGRWLYIVASDLLNQLRFYYRPVEKNRGEADRLFAEYSHRLEEILGEELDGADESAIIVILNLFEKLLAEAAEAFRSIQIKSSLERDIRTVYLCGDVFLRVDEFGSDDLARKLNDLGLRIILEPFGETIEYIASQRSKDLVEMDTGLFKNSLMRFGMDVLKSHLVAAVSKSHPWIKWEDYRIIDREGKRLLDGTPYCEANATIGSALYTWRTRPVDGIVVVSPWGCGPALISEAQLRRETEIPFHFVYNDGDPIDEAMLAGFAWRIKSSPRRRIINI